MECSVTCECRVSRGVCVFFFFQAEDGIRDLTVTGVQTCALPISLRDELERGLLTVVPDAVINAAHGRRAPHVTSVSIPGTDSEALLMHLDLDRKSVV